MNRLAGSSASVAKLEPRLLLFADYNFDVEYNDISLAVPHVLQVPVPVGGILEDFVGESKGDAVLQMLSGTPYLVYTPNVGAHGIDSFTAVVRYDDPYGGGSSYYYNNSVEVDIFLPISSPVDDESFTYDDPVSGNSYYSNYFVLKGNELNIPAEDGVLKNDVTGNGTDPLQKLSAVGVTAANQHIHGGVLPQYGTASVLPSGGFTYTPFEWVFEDPYFTGKVDTFSYFIRDVVGQESETANVTVDLAKVTINRQGTRKSDLEYGSFPLETDAIPMGTKFDHAWIGERVSLQASLIGEVNIPLKYQWTIPAYAIKSYSAHVTDDIAYVSPLLPADYKSSSCVFYWVTSGEKGISVLCTAAGQTVSAEETMTAESPTATMTATVYHPTYDASTGTVTLGDPANQILGVVFNITVAPPAGGGFVGTPGSFLLSQIVTATFTRTTASSSESRTITGIDDNFSYGLDVIPSQNSGDLNAPFDPSTPDEIGDWQDSPATDLSDLLAETLEYSLFASFETFLMYRPDDFTQTVDDSEYSIWVPLKRLTWSWGFSATRLPGGGWDVITTPSPSYDMSVIGMATTQFPVFFLRIQSLLPQW